MSIILESGGESLWRRKRPRRKSFLRSGRRRTPCRGCAWCAHWDRTECSTPCRQVCIVHLAFEPCWFLNSPPGYILTRLLTRTIVWMCLFACLLYLYLSFVFVLCICLCLCLCPSPSSSLSCFMLILIIYFCNSNLSSPSSASNTRTLLLQNTINCQRL